MSSVIDPVTGLPIVVPYTTGLDTIPLGVQTFPWKDYKATQRPNRQLMYPDDIIPVSANVAGMYQDQSQVVGTDGNHALLVSDVNGGGGGGGGGGSNPTPIDYGSFGFAVVFDETGGESIDVVLPGVIALITLAVSFTELDRLGIGNFGINVINQGAELDIRLGRLSPASAMSPGLGTSGFNVVLPFNPPWLVRRTNAFPDTLYTVDVLGTDGPGTLSCRVWGYNLP